MPLVLFIIYKILIFFGLQEVTEWTVGWNLFAVSGAIVQQVSVVHSKLLNFEISTTNCVLTEYRV